MKVVDLRHSRKNKRNFDEASGCWISFSRIFTILVMEKQMNFLLRLEEFALMTLSFFLLYKLGFDLPWWAWILLFFSPDLGMLGDLVNARVGAVTYNLFHHKLVAVAILAFGYASGSISWQVAGFILLAHACFDRIFGYGLKYPDSFKHTSSGNL